MGLVRRLVLAALKHNIVFKAVNIPKKANPTSISEYLSRVKLQGTWQAAGAVAGPSSNSSTQHGYCWYPGQTAEALTAALLVPASRYVYRWELFKY